MQQNKVGSSLSSTVDYQWSNLRKHLRIIATVSFINDVTHVLSIKQCVCTLHANYLKLHLTFALMIQSCRVSSIV